MSRAVEESNRGLLRARDASVVAGVLWTTISPAAGLLFAAGLMAVALVSLAWGARPTATA